MAMTLRLVSVARADRSWRAQWWTGLQGHVSSPWAGLIARSPRSKRRTGSLFGIRSSHRARGLCRISRTANTSVKNLIVVGELAVVGLDGYHAYSHNT